MGRNKNIHRINNLLIVFLFQFTHLGAFGGTTIAKTTRLVLESLVGPELSRAANWKGKGGKIPFSKYSNINKLIHCKYPCHVYIICSQLGSYEYIIEVLYDFVISSVYFLTSLKTSVGWPNGHPSFLLQCRRGHKYWYICLYCPNEMVHYSLHFS